MQFAGASIVRPGSSAVMAGGGGYKCEFVDKPSKLFECPLCSFILREPQLTKCCGRNVCLPCVADLKQEGKPCPLCKQNVLTTALNRHQKNMIDDLQVRCSMLNRGCEWTGRLEVYEKHEEECGFVETDCPYKCGARLQRRNREEHAIKCTRYPVPCNLQCGASVERRLHSLHLRDCPLSVADCPFNHVGCASRTKLKDQDSHLEMNFQEHFQMVVKQSSEIQARYKETLRGLVSDQEQKLEETEVEVATLKEMVQKLEEKSGTYSNVMLAAEGEMQLLRSEGKRNQASLNAELSSRDAEIQMLKHSIAALQTIAKLKCYGPPMPTYTHLVSRPIPPTKAVHIPPIVVTLDNFEERRCYDEIWHSPPFYTHQGGYKLCLRVYPNGLGTGHLQWISIFCFVVKGEYDHVLRWPMRCDVVVEILNQKKDSIHLAKTISFEDHDNDGRQRVTDGFIAETGLGFHQFMLQRMLPSAWGLLSERQYLMNNCLKIRICNLRVYS